MNEKAKSFFDKIKGTWKKWSAIQKGILIGSIIAVLIVIVLLVRFSARPSLVPVLDVPITDVQTRDRIQLRLNEENVRSDFSDDGKLYVNDEETARRMRSILIREDLIPTGTNPWDFFNVDKWSITDFERNVNLRRAIIKEVTQHIKALDDVDDASLSIVMPENKLFKADQKPVTASVILFQKPGSDLPTNRKKIEGIQKLVKFAVEGLTDDNITITDSKGNVLNDFAIMADFDRLSATDKQQKMIQRYEAQYEARIIAPLQNIFGMDRVRDLNIKIEMNMSERSSTTKEYLPFVRKPDNPDTIYDDSEIFDSVTRSSETASTTWQGTALDPQGPAGTEGQAPPAYKDPTNLAGLSTQTIVKTEQAIGERNTSEVISPELGRRTVSVNIDGLWQKKKDEKGNYIVSNGKIEREYIPLTEDELRDTEKIVRDAIGYDATRKDSVTVTNIRIDRTSQFEKEDQDYFADIQRRTIILISLAAIAVILFILILYRIVTRELERRKRLREEEALRKAQLERQQAMWEADQGKVVSITAEERHRMELQENAINLSREHPEDVAMLIRTWLMEE